MEQQTDVRELLAHGDTLLRDNRSAEAAAEFARAVQQDASAVGGHVGLAEANLALGQYDIARQAALTREACDFHTIKGSDHGFDSRGREDEAIAVTVDWLLRRYA